MRELSNIPAYKSIAPTGSYFDFERLDKADDGKWVKYWHHLQGIVVEFNPNEGHSSVVVGKTIHQPREDWEKFKSLMYDFVDEYVYGVTRRYIAREKGFHVYQSTIDDRFVTVEVSSGSSFSFSVSVPYGEEVTPFPRLAFAKRVMKMLSDAFHAEKKARV